jgi:hypothetical protein
VIADEWDYYGPDLFHNPTPYDLLEGALIEVAI